MTKCSNCGMDGEPVNVCGVQHCSYCGKPFNTTNLGYLDKITKDVVKGLWQLNMHVSLDVLMGDILAATEVPNTPAVRNKVVDIIKELQEEYIKENYPEKLDEFQHGVIDFQTAIEEEDTDSPQD